ncbi:DUF429 domain-containing protein [Actinoplanes sp. NPDC020271]|uniref:DUF429 domain-containing protein n=1 Tax=Actinoplanes sp. NPDC020271 TaxID=3363896 RepID=UPI0037B99895
MLTVGIDLAAEPPGTAIAAVEWSATAARLRQVVHPADDDAVVAAIQSAGKAGVDCPLGWPDAFVSFVAGHRAGAVAGVGQARDKSWRRGLAWRLTDEVVREATGIVPLSVAADRIAHTAMRCAAVQARLADLGEPVDRSGAGVVVEVYPAASLKIWGLPVRGYKGPAGATVREALVHRLRAVAPWLDLGDLAGLCVRSDHVLDAVVAALAARAAAIGVATRPAPDQLAAARTEGWIALPAGALDTLLP